jgi:hypothetical protein
MVEGADQSAEKVLIGPWFNQAMNNYAAHQTNFACQQTNLEEYGAHDERDEELTNGG